MYTHISTLLRAEIDFRQQKKHGIVAVFRFFDFQ